MQLLLDVIKRRLYEDHAVRARILQDYGITTEPRTPDQFADVVIGRFDQGVASSPGEQKLSNEAVFKAAVYALASNNRTWATFLLSEPRLSELLGGYSPSFTHDAFGRGTLPLRSASSPGLVLRDVQACLPGLSGTSDARAILDWATLLDRSDFYSDGIRQLALELRNHAIEKLGHAVPESHLPLLMVGALAGTVTRNTPGFVQTYRDQLLLDGRKLPGMGYVLASEFLRNLHWGAFKPDRHIQRLFHRWCPTPPPRIEMEVRQLQQLLGRQAQDLATYLRYSVLGLEATPPGTPLTYADNLVWLLAAYVEKKGRESSTVYMES